jgi:hypothetical protein
MTIEEEFVDAINDFNKGVCFMFVEILLIGVILTFAAYYFGYITI